MSNLINYDFGAYIQFHAIDLADLNNDSVLDVIAGSQDENLLTVKIETCRIWFNDTDVWRVMAYNSSAELYYYNRTFSDDGNYTWNISCEKTYYETETFSSNLIVINDSTPPTITLHDPDNGASITTSSINFNWTAVDDYADVMQCSLTINDTVNKSNIASTNNTPANYTVFGFSNGIYYWNITCIDDAGNVNTSLTYNFTIRTEVIDGGSGTACDESNKCLLIENSTDVVARFDKIGNIDIKGALSEEQSSLTPPAGSFIINKTEVTAYIDKQGNLQTLGKFYQNSTITYSGNDDFIIMNSTGSAVGFIDGATGNMYFKGVLHYNSDFS